MTKPFRIRSTKNHAKFTQTLDAFGFGEQIVLCFELGHGCISGSGRRGLFADARSHNRPGRLVGDKNWIFHGFSYIGDIGTRAVHAVALYDVVLSEV